LVFRSIEINRLALAAVLPKVWRNHDLRDQDGFGPDACPIDVRLFNRRHIKASEL